MGVQARGDEEGNLWLWLALALALALLGAQLWSPPPGLPGEASPKETGSPEATSSPRWGLCSRGDAWPCPNV